MNYLATGAFECSAVGGWTDARVELLKKLWLDGKSASQIAKQLGGVTRNAVIGKVHRLGLSGRAAPSQPGRLVFKAPRPPRPVQARPLRRLELVADSPKLQSEPVNILEEPGTATILTLGAHMCKWPIGEPANADFTFCGRRSGDGPYCVKHARVAYQPQVAQKRRVGATELARALRRYI
jgi:GcrA cell cycle regulator